MEDEQVGTGQEAHLSQPTAIHHETQFEGEVQPRVDQARVYDSFDKRLESLINEFSMESASGTPDFILASYLRSCLNNWNMHIQERDKWFRGSVQPTGTQPDPDPK